MQHRRLNARAGTLRETPHDRTSWTCTLRPMLLQSIRPTPFRQHGSRPQSSVDFQGCLLFSHIRISFCFVAGRYRRGGMLPE
eukprot:1577859-Prorocentrum_lima.AAC.1